MPDNNLTESLQKNLSEKREYIQSNKIRKRMYDVSEKVSKEVEILKKNQI